MLRYKTALHEGVSVQIQTPLFDPQRVDQEGGTSNLFKRIIFNPTLQQGRKAELIDGSVKDTHTHVRTHAHSHMTASQPCVTL